MTIYSLKSQRQTNFLHFVIGVSIVFASYRLNFIGPVTFFVASILSIPFRLRNCVFSFWGGVNYSGNLITVIGLYAKARAHLFVIFGCSIFQEAGFGIWQFGGISIFSKAGENITKFLAITIFSYARHSLFNILSMNLF